MPDFFMVVRLHELYRLANERTEEESKQCLYDKLSKPGTSKRDIRLGKGTIHFVHTLLRMVFKLAVTRRKILFNPMDGVKAPGGADSGQKVRIWRRWCTIGA